MMRLPTRSKRTDTRCPYTTLVRSLLSWRRDDLTVLALEADLPLVEDPSNSDIRFDRARLRQALRSQTILDPQAAARSAAWLADADADRKSTRLNSSH